MSDISELIMMNLYYSDILKKEDNEVATLKTINNDYIIEFSRKYIKSWFSSIDNNSFKYLCRYRFKNIFDNLVYELLLSEIDMYTLLDNISNYISNNLMYIIVPFQSSNKLIELKRKNNIFNDNIILSIIDNNTKRISIEFDIDILSRFVDISYFIFLIDIDSNKDFYT